MGAYVSSGIYHEDEKGVPDSLFLVFNYSEQSEDEYRQLDTENDQKGDTAVEHIFKKTKTVYGQPAKDMKGIMIDWAKDYNISLTKRPCPYDFPAFEADKPPDYDEKVISFDSHFVVNRKLSWDTRKEAEPYEKQTSDAAGGKNAAADGSKKRSQPKRKGSRSRSRSKSKGKKGPKGKKSADVDMDECSLEN
ncbi:unnamed protein product [Anisakis simplex]|uniref:Chromo domain-containing protein n=1 Tax=Anisakis simplex TaxID=6269 RepID=A0A0M3J078_ANISI|nr:unnamed protein product [Anisakis simplex]